MTHKIMLYLPANAGDELLWAGSVDASANIVVQHGEAGLVEAARDKTIIVIVPATDVTTTVVRLPKMSRHKLLQAVPFAIEEQLVNDLQQVHIAAGAYDETAGVLPIAIVDREKMQGWLARLQALHIVPHVLLPETYCLPLQEATWTLRLHDDVILRRDQWQGAAMEREQLSVLMQAALQDAGTPPQHLIIENYSRTTELPTMPMPATVKDFSHHSALLDDLQRAALLPPINLLQGAFNVKHPSRRQQHQRLRAAKMLAIGLLAVLCASPIISYFILHRAAAQLSQQIATIYHRYFPNAKAIVAPKERMMGLLQAKTGAGADNELLRMLLTVGVQLQHAPGVNIEHLHFQSDKMTLGLQAPNSDTFSSYSDAISQAGYKVTQQNVSLAGEKVKATIEIAP